MPISLAATQFLVSKICHDLAGPIGAVGAGVEALSEQPGDTAALQLIDETAQGLAAKMGLFRIVMGHGGQAQLGDPDALKGMLGAYLASLGGRVELVWPDNLEPLEAINPNATRLYVLLILIGVDCLPRGGTLSIALHPLDPGLGIAITADHDRATIRDDIKMAWQIPLSEVDTALSARNIHVYLARVLAEDLGAEIELSADRPGRVTLAMALDG